MATASATISPATVPAVTMVGPSRSSKRATRVKYINGLNSFGGLKAHNNVVSLGLPVSTEQSFANIVSSMKNSSHGGGGGGALISICNAVDEIFKIAAIVPALVLIGVAVGFVLLRIEAAVEEE
ncbi:cytochrome b6f complex subunit [Perilla frutescens var. hirtella]|nr:cytochrome b6f complex subunit [Perilla frutescens var. hirtella]KAH6811853.1 cytochrome b6f complex subunit [Perilla frutescens var. frutescens]